MTASTINFFIVSLVFMLIINSFSWAEPPEYKTFKRAQKTDYHPSEKDVMRIWMFYVGQGDGMLIQMPAKYAYNKTNSNGEVYTERLDILVDGGPPVKEGIRNISDLIQDLYPNNPITIEHIVLSHHDQDHVRGISNILKYPGISVERIFHNGLVSYKKNSTRFNDCQDKIINGKRLMACLTKINGKHIINSEDVIDNLQVLRKVDLDDFHGEYLRFAKAIRSHDDIVAFPRAYRGKDFVLEAEAKSGRNLGIQEIRITPLWPLKNMEKYSSGQSAWGKTINGHSVTFNLEYKNFTMLFTGDQNKFSQKAMARYLTENNMGLSELKVDILKLPHHGSNHSIEEFIKPDGKAPVLAIASQGEKGARSKEVFGSGAWQHPSEKVIGWIGGAHRVYNTQIHEKRFKWKKLVTQKLHDSLKELSHILIETDGEWFRIVEIPATKDKISIPLSVKHVKRSDGTRWIRAKSGREE